MNVNSSRESPPIIYQPLDTRAIRLITLLPGTPPELIRIDLDIVPIDSCTACEALSYAWDDQKPSVLVSCGKQSILVTQNVHDALLELRSSETIRYLWIDQICINQQDLTERSKQVSLMGEIYIRAKCAVVWLGKADQETAVAFDTIRKLTTMHECSDSGTDDLSFIGPAKDIKTAVDTYCSDRSEKMRAAVLNLPVMDSPEFGCLLGLLRRTWFKRMWVFQEVVLASNLTEFRCGSYSSNVWDFHRAVQVFHRCKYDAYLSVSERRAAGDAASITRSSDMVRRSRSLELIKFDLEMLLIHTKMLRCQDPRDRVYALLGICDQKYLPYVIPDYTQPLADVYCAAFKATIAADRSLTMLGHIQWFDAKPSDVPSWVPDWRETRTAFGVTFGLRSLSHHRYFNVCNYQPLKTLPTSNPYHLAVRGTRFRRITRRLPDRITLQREDVPLDAMRYRYSNWCELYKAEAARLAIPECCIRMRGYGVGFADDILCHQIRTETVSSEILLAITLRRTLTADLYPRPVNSRRMKHEWQANFPLCARWALQKVPTEPTPEVLREHDQDMDDTVRSRQLFIAGEGPDDAYLCLASGDTRVGDLICILCGGDVPYVIRQRPLEPGQPDAVDNHTWEFICECYVDGIMDGEVFQEFHEPDMETFVLD